MKKAGRFYMVKLAIFGKMDFVKDSHHLIVIIMNMVKVKLLLV